MSLPLPAHEAEPELDPGRLRAHQQAGFSRVYQLKPDITTAAVEAPQHIAFVAEPAELKLRVQANLIRLFQIAILVDDFFPSDADEKPSDRLMNIIEVLWDVDVPGIGAPAMRDILKHWYGRHLDWWKANRRSKKVSAGREAVLFALMDQYRRSRRYGLTRREREAESSGNALEASFRSSKGTEVHPRYLASRALQWFQIQFNCADAVHIRVLPCPPPVMDYMSDKGTAFSGERYNLVETVIGTDRLALQRSYCATCCGRGAQETRRPSTECLLLISTG